MTMAMSYAGVLINQSIFDGLEEASTRGLLPASAGILSSLHAMPAGQRIALTLARGCLAHPSRDLSKRQLACGQKGIY